MLYYPPVEYILALLRRYHGLRVDAKMKSVKIINTLTNTFFHSDQESVQSRSLIPAFNFCDAVIFNSQAYRLTEIG